eukprot:Sspe_Gene.18961::Locus_6864_Transcript_1_1_Confidence_1.000_Length_724::g.18961::m.18961
MGACCSGGQGVKAPPPPNTREAKWRKEVRQPSISGTPPVVKKLQERKALQHKEKVDETTAKSASNGKEAAAVEDPKPVQDVVVKASAPPAAEAEVRTEDVVVETHELEDNALSVPPQPPLDSSDEDMLEVNEFAFSLPPPPPPQQHPPGTQQPPKIYSEIPTITIDHVDDLPNGGRF